ncbi:MAG: hypothetical protein ACRD1R_11695 [Acidobacteriota bacterium]
MRLIILILLLLQFSAGLIWRLRPPQKEELYSLIPKDVLGLIVIDEAPERLDFLERTQLGKWADVDIQSVREKIPPALREQLVLIFDHDLEEAWIFVHHLERQEEGSLRIHFSALLEPQALHQQALELRIKMGVLNTFGPSDTQVLEQENILIYRGTEPGQILYLVRMPGYLMISNSDPGWLRTLRTSAGKQESLAESYSFRKIKSHVWPGDGIFLYFNARQLFPLLPEFGYSVRWEEGEISDRYYEIKRGSVK